MHNEIILAVTMTWLYKDWMIIVPPPPVSTGTVSKSYMGALFLTNQQVGHRRFVTPGNVQRWFGADGGYLEQLHQGPWGFVPLGPNKKP